jgi:hypothetical protein
MDTSQRSSVKTLLIAIGGLVVLLVLSAVLWWVISGRSGADSNASSTSGTVVKGTPYSEPSGRNASEELPNIPEPPSSNAETLPLFVQLTNDPVAGIGIEETSGALRFVERARGYIYDLRGLDKESVRRITNTTVLGVQEAYFGNGGATVILRSLDDTTGRDVIKTYLGRIYPGESAGSDGKIEGKFLADDILEANISADGTKAVFVVSTPEGSSIQITDIADGSLKEILRSPLREWIPFLANTGDVLLSTKATYDAAGALYRINVKNGTYGRVVGGKIAMTTLPSPDGHRALFSDNEAGEQHFALAGIPIAYEGGLGGTAGDTIALGIHSIAQKCTWDKKGIYAYCAAFSGTQGRMPDDWYQGVTSLSDTFWRIDSRNGDVVLLGDPYPEIGRRFDAVNLLVSPDGSTLYFINKPDGTLWGMRIKEPDGDKETTTASTTPLTPEELRDIKGSNLPTP